MKTKLFPLFDDTKDVLRITHDTPFQHCKIEVNDHEIAVINSKADLKKGFHYDLGGGNRLEVKLLNKYFIAQQLQVLVNNEAAESSDTSPETQFKWVLMAAAVPFLMRLDNFIDDLEYSISFVSHISGIEFLLEGIVVLGLLYYFRTTWSLYLVIAFYTMSLFLQFLYIQNQLGTSNYTFIFGAFRALVFLLPTIYLVIEGLPIVKNLKAPERHNDNPNILDSK